jgi:hypothetical protein
VIKNSSLSGVSGFQQARTPTCFSEFSPVPSENCFDRSLKYDRGERKNANNIWLAGVVSQIVEAYARGERNSANNAWLAAAG